MLPAHKKLLRNIILASLILLPAHGALACQLVCIVIPYPFSGPGWNSPADRTAACNTARAGFKPATAGMVSSLPSLSTDFFMASPFSLCPGGVRAGAVNGIPCDANANILYWEGGAGTKSSANEFCGQVTSNAGGNCSLICCNM